MHTNKILYSRVPRTSLGSRPLSTASIGESGTRDVSSTSQEDASGAKSMSPVRQVSERNVCIVYRLFETITLKKNIRNKYGNVFPKQVQQTYEES